MTSNATNTSLDQPSADDPTHSRPTTKSKAKSKSKCEKCRDRKIKCTPTNRDPPWEQKCDPCLLSGHECGPNTIKTRTRIGSNITAASTQSDPEFAQPTFDIIVEESILKPETTFVQPHYSPRSSSTTPSLPRPSSTSLDEHEKAKFSALVNPVYKKCRQRLSDMGPFIDLYRFVQHRRKALDRMKIALPRLDTGDIEGPLRYLLRKIRDRIIKYFRQLEQSRKELNSGDWEIVTRRMLIIGEQYLDLHQVPPDSQCITEAFRTAHANLKEELSNHYRDSGDNFEADSVRFQPIGSSDYLAHCPMQTLHSVARRISASLEEVLADLDPDYKDDLELGQPIEITAAHLALMFRQGTRVNPAECLPSGGTGLTGRNTYHLAAEVGNAAYLKYHLENSPEATRRFFTVRDVFRMTPLIVAAYSGDLEVFKTLVKYGADLREQMPGGRSVLCIACMAGKLEIAEFILSNGVSIQDRRLWCSPLHDAAGAGRQDVVNYLKHLVSPNQTFEGWTAAAWALRWGHSDIAHSFGPHSSLVETPEHASHKSRKKRKTGPATHDGDTSEDIDEPTLHEMETDDFEIDNTLPDTTFDPHNPLDPSNIPSSSDHGNFWQQLEANNSELPESSYDSTFQFDHHDFQQ